MSAFIYTLPLSLMTSLIGKEVIDFYSYKEAKEKIKKYKIKSSKHFRKFNKLSNRPKRIPRSPQKVYKNNGWVSWQDFLGNSEKKIILNKKDDWDKFIKEMIYQKTFLVIQEMHIRMMVFLGAISWGQVG